jgi:restriction system protein
VKEATPTPTPAPEDTEEEQLSPEEAMANGYAVLRANLAAELLERIMAKPPGFFEKLVVDLLLALGYGGSRAEAGTVTKASGDGGIDGVINEHRLGLDAVYVQAKRWEDNVGVKALREFVGSLSARTRPTKASSSPRQTSPPVPASSSTKSPRRSSSSTASASPNS